jgi:hypothetical protein
MPQSLVVKRVFIGGATPRRQSFNNAKCTQQRRKTHNPINLDFELLNEKASPEATAHVACSTASD